MWCSMYNKEEWGGNLFVEHFYLKNKKNGIIFDALKMMSYQLLSNQVCGGGMRGREGNRNLGIQI